MRAVTISIAFGFAAIPLYPALIFLASVAPPGVSLVPPQIAAVVLCLALAGAGFLGWTLLRERAPRSELARPIVVYLAGWTLAALAGLDPLTGSLFVAAGVLSFVLHLGVARYYGEPYVATVLYAAFLSSALIVTLLGIGLLAGGHDTLLYRAVNGRAVSTFIVPGEFAGYLCIVVPLGAGIALAARRPWLRWLGGAVALSGCVALWLTYSRAGIYGLSVGAAFFVYMQRRRWWVALVLIAALALEARWLLGFNDHHNPGEEFVRLPIWVTALRAVALFPLTGTGPGAFRHVFSAIGPAGGLAAAFHAHSYPLTALAETGIVGVIAALGLWWAFGRRLWSAIAGAEPRARLLSLALASAFVATLIQSTVDFVQVVILGCWLPCMALALAAARRGAAGA
jgi:O-antigen ligase